MGVFAFFLASASLLVLVAGERSVSRTTYTHQDEMKVCLSICICICTSFSISISIFVFVRAEQITHTRRIWRYVLVFVFVSILVSVTVKVFLFVPAKHQELKLLLNCLINRVLLQYISADCRQSWKLLLDKQSSAYQFHPCMQCNSKQSSVYQFHICSATRRYMFAPIHICQLQAELEALAW